MEKQSTSKLLRLMVAVFALFLLVMTGSVLSACGGNVAHEHKYGSPEHTNPSTCGSTGYDVYTCSECGDKYAVVTAATGKHTFTDGICTVCGVSNGDNLKAILDQINSKVGTTTSPENVHKHNFTQEVKKLDPTCLTFGITVMKCDCGSTSVTSLVQATGHKYSKAGETGNRIPSTCTTNGQIEVVCSQCGDTYWEPNKDDMAPGHDFTYRTKEFAEKNDQPANCVSPARIAYKCTRCDEIQYVNVGDTLGGHFYATDENGNEVWTKVEGSEKGSAAEKPTIDENLKSYIDVGTVDMERACIYCGEKQVKTVAADHDHNFQHTKTEFNRLTKVTYTATIDGVEKTFEADLNKENCTEEGAENWHCVYAGCEALENDAGKWEKVETTVEPAEGEEATTKVTYEYRPSGWAEELKDRKEKDTVDGVEHTYEWRAKLNHTYADKLKNDDGEFEHEDEIKEITEIDKDEEGNVIVSHKEGEAVNNTSTWFGQTCSICGHEIAFQTKEEEGKKVPDVTKEILVIERDDNGGVVFDGNDAWITRAWHSWVLYNGKDAADTATPEQPKKEKIEPPAEPDGYEANKAATCTEEGWNWYWCQDSECKSIPRWVKVILPPLGHDWAIAEFKDPTCEKAGELKLECQRNGCNASLTLSVENYSEVTTADDWTWNRHTLKTPGEWPSEEGEIEYAEDYLKLWELGIDASSDEDADDAVRKLGSLAWREKPVDGTDSDEGEEDTNAPKTYTLADALKMLIPTGHHWKKSTSGDATVTADYCFGVPSQLYKCDCKMDGKCTDEGCKNEWRDENPKQEHKKNADGKIDTGIYYEYGVCGTAFGLNHDIYKVTYCKTCGLQLSREKVEDRQNYRHFPFDRKNIEALYNTYIPADYKVENGEKFLEVYGAEETARCMSDEARAARLEYARVWIGIEEWWFNNQTSSALEEDIRPYFYFKSGDKEDGGGFSLYCFDCFDNLHQYVATHKPEANDHTMTATMHYYVKLDSGAMMEISDLNKLTYNVCEYQYYLQYEVVCKCGMKYIGSDPEARYGAGQYIEQVQKDADGNEVHPDGVHYLIPVKEYWEKENYERGANGEATMDWICVFCGKTFELQVKYEAPKSEPAAADSETTVDPSNVKLVNADEKLILLVDMSGIKFDEKYGLNQRTGNTGDRIFEIDDRWYYGENKAWNDVYKTVVSNGIDSNVTITGGETAFYSEQATVLMKLWENDTKDIVIGRRGPAKYTTGYFEAGKSDTWVWAVDRMRIGSVLRPEDFVDPTDKDAYTAVWNDMFKIGTGDTYGEEQKKETNKLLDAYFKRGGEIVLGGNVGEPVPTTGDGANKSCGFGTQRTTGDGCVQTQGDNAVNVFVVPADTTIDLNDNTFYGNLFVNTGTIAGVKGGHSVIKNGKIVLEDKGRIQVVGDNSSKDVSLELDGVEVTAGETGLFAGQNSTITIKNSCIVAESGRAIEANNAETTGKSTVWVLENSAFISKTDTAFFMPGEGSVDAKDCEFYGYNMGVFLRGDNLEEKADGSSHARFVNCLFAKGDQASGAESTTSGTNTKHYGALTIGNDNKSAKDGYGSIKKLELKNCDFEIVKVAKNEEGVGTPGSGDWTPAVGEADEGWDLKDEVASPGCDLSSGEGHTKCDKDKCSHRAIVINICGCSDIEGGNCMTGTDECNTQCGQDDNGKVTIYLDDATLKNLITHAQKFSHEDAEEVTNPFLGCTFTDGAELKGKCCKLKIFLIGQSELELNWTVEDGEKLEITKS